MASPLLAGRRQELLRDQIAGSHRIAGNYGNYSRLLEGSTPILADRLSFWVEPVLAGH